MKSILDTLQRIGTKRLVINSLAGFEMALPRQSDPQPARVALSN
jgi:hypothetical protein